MTHNLKIHRSLALRIGTAMVALGVLAGVAGSSLVPNVPLGHVMLYAGAAALVALALPVVLAGVTFAWSHWSLRHGGTDPQWFWFSADPLGLVRLREQRSRESDGA